MCHAAFTMTESSKMIFYSGLLSQTHLITDKSDSVVKPFLIQLGGYITCALTLSQFISRNIILYVECQIK